MPLRLISLYFTIYSCALLYRIHITQYTMALVEVSQGLLQGGKATTDSGLTFYEFLGVPFAKPPLGNLRFKSPEPPEKWNGILDATGFKENKLCLQNIMSTQNFIGTEDCLYLNVFTPNLPESDSKSLPVMVFIHGGGFIYGNGINNQELGPDFLVDKEIVLVSINYRVGVLGFLNLNIPEASGNMGLKDQVQALKWVQQNIHKFGGDRHNVTIFGISAGSASVEYHILSPLSKGLFHKAILQSGSSLNHWAINYEPKKLILKLLENMDYRGPTDDDKAIFDYLSTSSINLLVPQAYKAIDGVKNLRAFFGFVPTIEKDFGDGNAMITDLPYKLLTEGRFNRVPVIAGVTEKEGYFMDLLRPQEVHDVSKNNNFADYWPCEIETCYKDNFNKKLSLAYSENVIPDEDSSKIGIDFFSDFDFAAGSFIRGEIIASMGVPVYFYEFCYVGNINFFRFLCNLKKKGATHSDDWTYIFKHKLISKHAQEQDISVRDVVTKLWTNFAKTSNPTPNNDLNIHWPSYHTSPVCLIIDDKPTIQTNYIPKKMEEFKLLYDKYGK